MLTNLWLIMTKRTFLLFSMMSLALVWLSGCASGTSSSLAKFKVVKVNRFLRMQSLRDKGFESIGRKHPQKKDLVSNVLPYENRGEEIVVIWTYNGPPLQNAPVKLYFDYSYSKEDAVYRVEKSYDRIVPGRHSFKFKNLGDHYYKQGSIANWRVSIYYNTQKVSEKKSAFFKES